MVGTLRFAHPTFYTVSPHHRSCLMDASHRPKIAETIVHETVRLREAQIGRPLAKSCATRAHRILPRSATTPISGRIAMSPTP
jgi:hypothetical protein